MLKKQIMLLKDDIKDKNEEKKIEKKDNNLENNFTDYNDDYSNNDIIEENPRLKNLNLRGGIIWNTNDFSTPTNIGNQAEDISISQSIIP